MRSRKLLALLLCLITFPAIAGYMTLLGAGVGSIAPVVSWVSTTDPTFPSSSLSFSRTSNATMFDSTGKLTYAPNNLLTQSNTFSNAAWTLSNATLASGVTDPLGGTNAFTVTANAANAQVYQGVPFTGAGSVNFIQAIWVKRRTGSGTVSIFTPNGTTKTPIAVNGSWQMFFTAGAGNGANIAYNTVFLDVSGDAVDIYAATLSAVTYETAPRTADQVTTTSSAYYGPRIDYDPNTLAVKGLLIEEARTNLYLNSNDLTNAATTADGVTRTTDGTLGPNGVSAMAKLTAIAGTGSREIYQLMSTVSGTVYTASAFVKKGNYRYVFVAYEVASGANGVIAIFDLDNPSAATQTFATGGGAFVRSDIINEGGGIYRISVTGSVTGAGTSGYLLAGFVGAATGNSTTTTEPTFTAAGTEYGYFFGAQLEADSFATSYIPTTTASVTRAADVVQFTGAALTALRGAAWSFLEEGQTQNLVNPVFMGDGTSAFIRRYGAAGVSSYNGASSVGPANFGSGSFAGAFRVGVSSSAAGSSLAANGGSALASGGFTFTNGASRYLGSYDAAAAYNINGWVKSFAIYNQRLPDATLQAKSVVGASYAANDNGLRFANNDNLPIQWRIAL